jgi:hypothetical protein
MEAARIQESVRAVLDDLLPEGLRTASNGPGAPK